MYREFLWGERGVAKIRVTQVRDIVLFIMHAWGWEEGACIHAGYLVQSCASRHGGRGLDLSVGYHTQSDPYIVVIRTKWSDQGEIIVVIEIMS